MPISPWKFALAQIFFSLLGSPRLERDGEPIAIDRQKALALLVYLTINNKSHRRDILANLLWSDYDQTRARAAVRRALASLTKALPGSWWITDRENIELIYKAHPSFQLDVDEFQKQLAECNTHGHPAAEICQACFEPLKKAISLYHGDFLSGFTLRDSPNFDDWQFNQTEMLRRDFANALERLANLYATQGDFDSAINTSQRWLFLDSLNEIAHRQLMLIFAQSGQRHAALRQYSECVRVLERELGVFPQTETTRLFELIKANQPLSELTQKIHTAPHSILISDSATESFTSAQTSEETPSSFEHLTHGQLIGRTAEMEKASKIWKQVNTSEARVLLISGEPGIGKSHLAREICAMAKSSNAEILTGQCYSENGKAYSPISQIIEDALKTNENLSLSNDVVVNLLSLAPTLVSRYPNLTSNQILDSQSAQRLLFESVISFIDALIEKNKHPLLILVEDVHWADINTLYLLRHLARRASTNKLKLLILVTYRDSESDLDEAHGLRDVVLDVNREGLGEHIHLSRFSPEITNSMLKKMLGSEGEISIGFLNAIYHETEGNPFFIEELCKSLITAGTLYYAGGHWRRMDMESISLPNTVRSAILSRIKNLPQDVQEVLRLAAIIGNEFDPETIQLASKLDNPRLQIALDHAERAELIKIKEKNGKSIFTFTHALIPFALRESVSGLRRQQLHAHIAEVLETQKPDDVESLAYHFVAAGVRAKAMEYSRQSAARAEKLYAYQSAIRHLQTALEMLDAREDVLLHIAVLEGLADLHLKINEGVQAIPIYLEALQLWRGLSEADIWIAVRLHRKIGEAVGSMNRYVDYQRFAVTSRSSLEEGFALIQNQSPHPESIRLLCALSRDAWYLNASTNWDKAESYAQSAVTMAGQLNLPVELSSALEALSIAYGARGQFRERVEVCQRRSELRRDPRFTDYRERVNVSYQLGRALLSVGEYEAALVHAIDAENLSVAIQDVTTQVNAMTMQSQCLFPLDRWDDLLAIDEKLREIQARNAFERLGVALCFHTALVSAIKRLRGESEQANILREEAFQIMTKIAGPPEEWIRNQRY